MDAAAKEGQCPPRLASALTRAREAEVNVAEVHFQLDVRDSVISDQRELIGALWRILDATGTSREEAMTTATREGIVATYDGTKESGLNGGIVDDGRGADGNPLESRTVVGARARARFDFWENYEHRPGATVGDAAAPPGASHPTRTRQGEGTFRDERGASREGRKGQDGGERRERRRASDVTPTKSSGVRRNAKGTRTREKTSRGATLARKRGVAPVQSGKRRRGDGIVRRGTFARVGRDGRRGSRSRGSRSRGSRSRRSVRFVLQRVRAERRAQIRGVHANRRESPRGRSPGIGGDGVQNRDEGARSRQTTRTARVRQRRAPLRRGVTLATTRRLRVARRAIGERRQERGPRREGERRQKVDDDEKISLAGKGRVVRGVGGYGGATVGVAVASRKTRARDEPAGDDQRERLRENQET